ncbi:MAG: CCA tRNA nucleotidyltransferase [Muribaculaceae bacterium]|nr:CCA tRNA nucleotidyltransferase [Muribaculaceae bacterium]
MIDVSEIIHKVDKPVFHAVGKAADSLSRECYAVGGIVRDILLERHSKDIDFLTVGSGIEVARELAASIGPKVKVNVFKNFGTAQMVYKGIDLEFVGARRESYSPDSRKPMVEDGTLDDDLLRRDFTINAMAICVNADRFGELVDKFDGLSDLKKGIIRTPTDPDITFSDDPLRMLRAIRFATQLKFSIDFATFEAIKRNANRIKIISKERIYSELTKIMQSPKPSIGWSLLLDSGLLKLIFPQFESLHGVESHNGRAHKDNFYHTLQVVDSVAAVSDNVWLRWAALFHDIGKPATKRWDDAIGWTFHNHNFIGAKMIPSIFRAMKFPLDDKMKYVQKLVELHMRPIALVEETVTDSAVRRLLVDAGDDINDLMILCRADITSKNSEKVKRYLANYDEVCRKMEDLEQRDALRNWQPPVDGTTIMKTFGLAQSPMVGIIKTYVREMLLASDNPNDPQIALKLMYEKGAELGLKPVDQTETN